MANQQTGVPHALQEAHEELSAALDKHIGQNDEKQRLARLSRMVERIETYVTALSLLPDAQEELRRRAEFVAQRCGESTDFANAQKQGLASLDGQTWDQEDSILAVEKLREWHFTPVQHSHLVDMRQDIEAVLHRKEMHLGEVAQEALGNWHTVCSSLKNDAQLLYAEGCWFLFYIHAYGVGPESEQAASARQYLDEKGTVALLKDIRGAVKSLMAWVSQQAGLVAGGKKKRRKKRGRPPADAETIKAEADLAARWDRTRDSKVGTYKGDFAKCKGMSLKEFDRLLSRVHRRKSRANK